ATLAGDALKGAVAVWITWAYAGEPAAMFAGLGAFLGHLFPLWLGFRGGKGMATFLGLTLALDWRVGLAGMAAWLVVAIASRMSSLSTLVAAALSPLYMALMGNRQYVLLQLILVVLIF